MQLFMIVPWLVAAGLAYWKMETNSSKLSEFDTTMAEEIKNDKDGSVKKQYLATLDDEKAKSKTLKEAYETLAKNEEKQKSDDGKKEIAKAKEDYDKQEQKCSVIAGLDKPWMPVLDYKNIAWVVGIFAGVGVLGHYLTKKILEMFNQKEG